MSGHFSLKQVSIRNMQPTARSAYQYLRHLNRHCWDELCGILDLCFDYEFPEQSYQGTLGETMLWLLLANDDDFNFMEIKTYDGCELWIMRFGLQMIDLKEA